MKNFTINKITKLISDLIVLVIRFVWKIDHILVNKIKWRSFLFILLR